MSEEAVTEDLNTGEKQEPTLADNDVQAMGVSFKTAIQNHNGGVTEMAMSTYIASDLNDNEVNKMLDKMSNAMKRQVAISEIPNLEHQIEVCKESIKNIEEDVVVFDKNTQKDWESKGKHGTVQLNENQRAKRDQQITNLAKWQEDLEKWVLKLRHAEALRDQNNGEVEQGKAVDQAA